MKTRKWLIIGWLAIPLALSGCGRETTTSGEDVGLVDAEVKAVPQEALPGEPEATRCAVSVYDKHAVTSDEIWAAAFNPGDADLASKLDETRLSFLPFCLDPTDTTMWRIGTRVLNDTASRREVFANLEVSNGPARMSIAFLYQGKQLLPTSGNIIVGRGQSAIAESANYIYEIRCDLRASECAPDAYPFRFPL